jgi:adenosylcobinamide-phosphate synthase
MFSHALGVWISWAGKWSLALACALLLDFLLGDRENWPHPARWMGRGYSKLENFWLRKKNLGTGPGIVTVLTVAGLSALAPWLLLRIPDPAWIRFTLEAFLFYWCLSLRGLSDEALRIKKSLIQKRLNEARKLLARVVGRDTQRLSPSEISRATVETIGESFVDGFLSPVFWGLLGGPAAAYFFKAVSTGDSMIGHPDPPYQKFGWAAARLDDAMNFIPARLSLFILAPAALGCGLPPWGLIRSFFKDRLKHASPNAAHGEAAFAGALGVKLGGVNFYAGKAYRQQALNVSGRVCGPTDIGRAVRLLWAAAVVTLAILLLAGGLTR